MNGTTDKRFGAFLGTLFFLLGAALACLVFIDQWTTIELRLPGVWYTTQGLHVFVCVAMFVCGWWAHRRAEAIPDEADFLFDSVKVYTRDNCSLCDRALELLSEYGAELPPVRLVDITTDPQLEQQHGEFIPVVEFDGKVRFRGIVSAELLKRLIHAKRRQRKLNPDRARHSRRLT